MAQRRYALINKAGSGGGGGGTWGSITGTLTDQTDLVSYVDSQIISDALQNVVEDTTPQLGGNLDGQGNDINLGAGGVVNLTSSDGFSTLAIDVDNVTGGELNCNGAITAVLGIRDFNVRVNGYSSDARLRMYGSITENTAYTWDGITVIGGTTDFTLSGITHLVAGNYSFDTDQTVGAGQDNYVLTYDNATGLISLEAPADESAVWGNITGTISAQTDLAAAYTQKAVAETITQPWTFGATINISAGELDIQGLRALNKSSNFLYINGNSEFASGTYFGGNVQVAGDHRVNGSINFDGSNAFNETEVIKWNTAAFLGSLTNLDTYLLLNRGITGSGAPLYVTQTSTGQLARFGTGSAGTAPTTNTVTLTNAGGIEATDVVQGSDFITTGTDGRMTFAGNGGYFKNNDYSTYAPIMVTGTKGGYGGISFDGAFAWMNNGASQIGLYDDTNNLWMIQANPLSSIKLYFNGSNKFQTTSTGCNITGDLNTVDHIYINEQSTPPSGVTSDGILWCKDTNNVELWFTNESGTDYQVAGGSLAESFGVKAASAETINNSATMQDDDELFFFMGANEVYLMTMTVEFTCTNSAAGLRFEFDGPTGSSGTFESHIWHGGTMLNHYISYVHGSAQFISSAPTSGSPVRMFFRGFVTNGSTAGNLQFRWAQQTATIINTVRAADKSILSMLRVG